MGRINTKIALAERKKQIEMDGGFISKSGNFCDHLGRQKGDKNPNAVDAMIVRKTELSQEWKRESSLYTWVSIQLLKGRKQKDILEEARELYEDNPEKYCTRNGAMLSSGVLSKWACEILKRA